MKMDSDAYDFCLYSPLIGVPFPNFPVASLFHQSHSRKSIVADLVIVIHNTSCATTENNINRRRRRRKKSLFYIIALMYVLYGCKMCLDFAEWKLYGL